METDRPRNDKTPNCQVTGADYINQPQSVITLTHQELLNRWTNNTVPIYRFSVPENSNTQVSEPIPDYDQEIIGATREESKKWIRLSPQNLPRLVDEVLIGNKDAASIFYEYWYKKLVRFFSPRSREDVEDLAQVGVIEISHALPGFENKGGGTFFQNLHKYCYTVARNKYYGYLRSRKRQPRTGQLTGRERYFEQERSDYDDERKKAPPTWEMFWEKAEKILPDQQWQIVLQMRNEYQNLEIMRNLGVLGPAAFREEVRSARQAIARHLLAPAGLKTINSPEFNSISRPLLKDAASRGKLEAIKILGLWYTTIEAFKLFLYQKEQHYRNAVPRDIFAQPTFSESPYFKEFKKRVKKLTAEGLTIDEIAPEIERHPSLVKQALSQIRKEGEAIKTTRPPNPRKDYTEFDNRVRDLRLAGMRNDDIALKLGVGIASVTRSVTRLTKSAKIPMRPRGGIRN